MEQLVYVHFITLWGKYGAVSHVSAQTVGRQEVTRLGSSYSLSSNRFFVAER
jgi:hypothetical protein